MAKAGLLPAVFLPDGEVRFDPDAIEKAVAEMTGAPSSEGGGL